MPLQWRNMFLFLRRYNPRLIVDVTQFEAINKRGKPARGRPITFSTVNLLITIGSESFPTRNC